MAGTAEEEPHRIGEDRHRGPPTAMASPVAAWPEPGPDLLGSAHPTNATMTSHGDGGEQTGDDQHFRTDEELDGHKARPAPVHRRNGDRLWRTSSSSSTMTTSGGMARNAMFSWLSANSVIKNGENPYTNPPTKAAGCHRTQRRTSEKHGQAQKGRGQGQPHVHSGHRPHSQVTGDSTTPRPTTLVSSSRLIPMGWKSHCE